MEFLLAFIWLIIPVTLLLVAMLAGRVIATRHEADLARRQATVAHIRATDIRVMLDPVPGEHPPMLVTSEVCLGIDHFRGFLGKLKNIFGGEVRSYAMTLDRARREVIMRLLEEVHRRGYNALANLRIEFADISGNATAAQKATSVSILASATAHYAATTTTSPVQAPVTAPLAG